jgi:hypothetical protein
MVNPGETVTFRAIIDPEPTSTTMGYKWSVSGFDRKKDVPSEIPFSGQGSPQISFRLDLDSFMAQLELIGIPEGCPHSTVVSATFDGVPKPVKLGGTGIVNFATVGRWMGDLAASNELPDSDQLLLHFVYPKRAGDRAAQAREAEVIAKIQRAFGVGQDRISVERKAGSRYVIELWRVPPGAENPACEICGNK